MYAIKITGYKGKVFIGKDHKPCKDKKNARLFKTRQAAATYILKHWKQWGVVADGSSTANVEEV